MARVGLATRAQDRPGDTITVFRHLGIAEAKDLQAVASQVQFAAGVILRLLGVDSAVELDDQPGLEAEEQETDRLSPLSTEAHYW